MSPTRSTPRPAPVEVTLHAQPDALDPAGWMLMGPSYATPIALDRAGLALKDMDVDDDYGPREFNGVPNTKYDWADD